MVSRNSMSLLLPSLPDLKDGFLLVGLFLRQMMRRGMQLELQEQSGRVCLARVQEAEVRLDIDGSSPRQIQESGH